MKKVQAIWQEEVIHNVEADCPYCGETLSTDELINKSTMIGGRNVDQKVLCHYCQKMFLLDIFV